MAWLVGSYHSGVRGQPADALFLIDIRPDGTATQTASYFCGQRAVFEESAGSWESNDEDSAVLIPAEGDEQFRLWDTFDEAILRRTDTCQSLEVEWENASGVPASLELSRGSACLVENTDPCVDGECDSCFVGSCDGPGEPCTD